MNKRLISLIPAILLSLTLGHSSAAASVGELLKLTCPASADADHPCRAVYYLGIDGKRHAFPNADVYFSWYDDFSSVRSVDDATLAAWPLGRNVTYRPGSKLVKLTTMPVVYAVGTQGALRPIPSEASAAALAGPNWAQTVADLPDVFFLDYAVGAPIDSTPTYDAAQERFSAPDINSELGASYVRRTVTTAGHDFDVRLITVSRNRFRMQTAAETHHECLDGCDAKPLKEYADEHGSLIGIHGSYFCPPDYAGCSGKEYSFRWPAYNSFSASPINESEIKYHEGPLLAQTTDGALHLWRDARIFTSFGEVEATTGSSVTAALANYPTLLVDGVKVVDTEARLDENQRTVRGSRGAIGWNDDDFFLTVVSAATVPETADVMKELGTTHAMNLDGGGSSALLFGGDYKAGPGRLLPNAIIFTPTK